MTCRRCNSKRYVAHHRNDIFEGWFCASCVDGLIDAFLATCGQPSSATAHFGRSSSSDGAAR